MGRPALLSTGFKQKHLLPHFDQRQKEKVFLKYIKLTNCTIPSQYNHYKKKIKAIIK